MARMAKVLHPRGRLPRRVYWVRRGMVLVVALLLVLGIGRFLGGTGADAPVTGAKASSTTAKQAPGASPTLGPVAPSIKLRTKAKVPLLPPSGPCLDDEISVRPSVPQAWASKPITINLELQGTQPACSFDVSPKTMVVKIVSGQDRIWSSQDCPQAIPTAQVVVRSGAPVVVPVTWDGRRSEEKCGGSRGWAFPGFYHVYAAALGSTPTDDQFEITHAAPNLVTRTPKPRTSASVSPAARPSTAAVPSKKSTKP